ncbi:MAG: MCE family protein, partial [Gammaproteobacteria bacterium]|nr:MCE family protein [Gammaproteobacteria bacterium]
MMKKITADILVGIFMILAALALMFLALKVSGLGMTGFGQKSYEVWAEFGNVGNLKPRAAIRVAGVQIGQVSAVILDKEN